MKNSKGGGFTIIELMLAMTISAVVLGAVVYFLSQALTYFQASRLRSQVLGDAVAARDVVRRFMQIGSARTLVIKTPNTNPASPPNSDITFNLSADGTSCEIKWLNQTVQMTVIPPGGTKNVSTLASNVTSLQFVVPDPAVPAQVFMTLLLSDKIDSKHTANVSLNDQPVQMMP